MTEFENDEIARNVALHRLADQIREVGNGDLMRYADQILRSYGVTWEREVNANGVAVRRPVLRGEWEADPEPPVHAVRLGDRVHYVDEEHGEHDNWVVMSVPVAGRDSGMSIVLLRRPEWGAEKFVSTTARFVRITSRPAGGNQSVQATPVAEPAPDPSVLVTLTTGQGGVTHRTGMRVRPGEPVSTQITQIVFDGDRVEERVTPVTVEVRP